MFANAHVESYFQSSNRKVRVKVSIEDFFNRRYISIRGCGVCGVRDSSQMKVCDCWLEASRGLAFNKPHLSLIKPLPLYL